VLTLAEPEVLGRKDKAAVAAVGAQMRVSGEATKWGREQRTHTLKGTIGQEAMHPPS
jgi:hypothetical protein